MAKKVGSESKQGLIITLVFFILATLGLGIGTYYGFAGQEELANKAKKEASDKKTFQEERDWYRFQALAYRAMLGQMGTINAEELGPAKASFDDGTLGKAAKDREEVANVFKTLGGILPWPKGKNLPETTYIKLVADERNRADGLEKQNKSLTNDKSALLTKVQNTEEALRQANETRDKELVKANQKAEADLSGFVKTIDEQRGTINKLGAEKDTLVRRLDDEKTKSTKQIAGLEKDLRAQRDLLAAKLEELNLEKLNKGGVEMPKDWSADWRVVSIAPNGRQVYINLGSRDNIRPQLTFSIHGTDLSGRPVAESKGSLEVVNVVGNHLSQARITGLKDNKSDPVLVNDVLYNPTWSPTLKRHVAVAGIVDLTGDGKDSMQEFRRNLERQNVIVDAWFDLRDGTIKGSGITPKTEYLILGEGAEVFSERQEKDLKDVIEKLTKGIGDMQDQAKRYGVQTIPVRRYLDLIGYRLPRPLADRQPGTQYRAPVTSTTDTPQDDKPAPPKAKPGATPPKDAKKAEDKPKPNDM